MRDTKLRLITALVMVAMGSTISMTANAENREIYRVVEAENTEKDTEEVERMILTQTANTRKVAAHEQDSVLTVSRTGRGLRFMLHGTPVQNRFVTYKGAQYLTDNNGFARIGLIERDGKLYFFEKDGRRKTGWIYRNEKWYFLDQGAFATGWQEIEGASYFFGEDGVMYESRMTPDGSYVDQNGRKVDLLADDNKETFTWDKDRTDTGAISGLMIAGHPAELYMLSTAGETSGFANMAAVAGGDRGRAYGICQFDYRYDLTGFMYRAYEKHPALWAGFEPYLGIPKGSGDLVYNRGIGDTFLAALSADFETAVSDQMEEFARLYWNETESRMNEAGFDLGNRHISVSSAIFSINVNCGNHTSLYLKELSPEMTDEEMIRKLYHLRNTVMAREHVGSALKGTNTRYLSAEPQMALDMLYGYTTIDSHINYGGGVEWHGNPFIGTISTIAGSMRTDYYASQSDAEKASGSDAEKEEIAVVSDEPEEEEEIGPGIVLRKKLEAESRAAEEASRAAEETAQTETETGI